jgi:hypothetical protein
MRVHDSALKEFSFERLSKLGAFPMTYLGLPISDKRLSKAELSDRS